MACFDAIGGDRSPARPGETAPWRLDVRGSQRRRKVVAVGAPRRQRGPRHLAKRPAREPFLFFSAGGCGSDDFPSRASAGDPARGPRAAPTALGGWLVGWSASDQCRQVPRVRLAPHHRGGPRRSQRPAPRAIEREGKTQEKFSLNEIIAECAAGRHAPAIPFRAEPSPARRGAPGIPTGQVTPRRSL